MSAITILAMDNSPLFLQGLLACLRQMPTVAKAEGCYNQSQLLEKIKTVQPQLVFLELVSENEMLVDFSVCRKINNLCRNTFIALIGNGVTAQIANSAYQNGAKAIFDKNVETIALCKFLNAFSLNLINDYYSSGVFPVKRVNIHPAIQPLLGMLTRREIEIMELIIEGYTIKQIECDLKITYETYKTHHRNLLQKLGLKNDVSLLRFVIGHNLYRGNTTHPIQNAWQTA